MEERWKEEIVDQMREALENENVTVERKSVELRGRETDTVSVNFKDAPYTMHFELDKYCDMVSVGVPTSEIAFALAREANDAHLHAPNLRSPEELQRSLYCTVANAETNQELLQGRPYMKIEDLVVIPRCKISEDARGMSSFAVTDQHLGLIQFKGAPHFIFRRRISPAYDPDFHAYTSRILLSMISSMVVVAGIS